MTDSWSSGPRRCWPRFRQARERANHAGARPVSVGGPAFAFLLG